MQTPQYELFISRWLAAKSMAELARTAGISRRRAYRIAHLLRVAGVQLPILPRYRVSMLPSKN
jgi:hypothetical protein